ncbi:hypothetical protein B0H16DRAFT_1782282 [Mycena metata]|uniref:Uncharacterized protein n=1 Tax=Mycena metata TaxID=1033252 RepID=A0AAD7MPE5_9AGAR|nr:hypothetical protein B0H16DRAFT_1782282 [Mycena metata]
MTKPIARAAAAGSTPDLQRLLRAAAELSQTLYISFLPVFFPNLDPRGIPNAEQLDSNLTLGDPVFRPIINAMCALSYISTLNPIPPEATQLIWGRIQPWIHFLHTYWTCISGVVAPLSELDLYTVFLSVVARLKTDPVVLRECHRIPEIRVIVAHAWKLFLLQPEDRTPHEALREVLSFLSVHARESALPNAGTLPPVAESGSRHLEQFAEGAGGLVHLATLTVQHLNRYVTRPEPTYSGVYLSRVIIFVITNKEDHLFHAALLSCGIVAAFVRAASAIAEGRDNNGPGNDAVFSDSMIVTELLSNLWSYLAAQFGEPPSPHRLLIEAIRAGLFPAMITSASNNRDPATIGHLEAALTPFGLRTCFYSVLSCLESALHDVEDLQATPVFVQSDFFGAWSTFWDLAQSRINILKRYKSASYVSLKAAPKSIGNASSCAVRGVNGSIIARGDVNASIGKTVTAPPALA